MMAGRTVRVKEKNGSSAAITEVGIHDILK